MAARHREPAYRRSLRRFVRTYGWRAYALPALTVVTIVALVRPSGHHSPAAATTTHRGNAQADAPHRRVEGFAPGASKWQRGATPDAKVIRLNVNDLSSCAQNTYRQLILVSLSEQHLWACEGRRQVNDTPVTTGSTVNGDQTPIGSWRLQDKQRDRYLVGPGYRDYVKYWMPFNGDFGLHDASWQTMPFGSQNYHVGGSHGCVHVPTPTMAWLYRWAAVGKTVVTIER